MRITNVRVTHHESSAWGDFYEREAELHLVTAMAIYPKYKHPISTWRPPEGMCFVEVETDEGFTGIGWCEDYCQATSRMVEQHLSRFLIGADPLDKTLLWDQMFRASIPYGRKGAALYGISALDIALWDLVGKSCNQPVYQLLGGKVRDSIPTYASHLHYENEEDFCAEAADYVARGYRAMKMRFKWGPADGLEGMNRNVGLVKMLRETVGDSIDLMGDAYMGWTLEYAKRITRKLAPFDLKWIEEPLMPDELEAYMELTRSSPVPIAAGEHEFTRYGFDLLIRNKAVNIVQFDMGRVGGFTEAKRVCALATVAGLPVCTHAYGLPTLQFITSEPACLMAEHFPVPVWMREDQPEVGFFDGAPSPVNGMVSLSDEPGMGYRLNLPESSTGLARV